MTVSTCSLWDKSSWSLWHTGRSLAGITTLVALHMENFTGKHFLYFTNTFSDLMYNWDLFFLYSKESTTLAAFK